MESAALAARTRRILRYVPVALRGRPLRGAERYRPFFVVGSGRCGTTLLRAILEAHPDIHVPPENPLRPVLRDYRRYSRLPWSVVLRIVLGRLQFHATWERWDLALRPVFRAVDRLPPRSRHLAAVLDALYRAHTAAHKPTAIRWGDKTPPNTGILPELHRVFPDLQVVHLIRDGRDVVQSFMEASTQNLAYVARAWLRAVRLARAFAARHPRQYLEVRYEDLVTEPQPTIQRVATFLGLSLDARMLHHHELGLVLGDVERYASLQGVRQPLHQASIGKWRTAFDARQLAELDRLLGPALATLGYEAS